jgi:hypothetical protein
MNRTRRRFRHQGQRQGSVCFLKFVQVGNAVNAVAFHGVTFDDKETIARASRNADGLGPSLEVAPDLLRVLGLAPLVAVAECG